MRRKIIIALLISIIVITIGFDYALNASLAVEHNVTLVFDEEIDIEDNGNDSRVFIHYSKESMS